ncbi:MAG: SRPBCC family protein [Chloroflexota bacterium]
MPTVEKSVTIHAAPDKIWGLLKDPAKWHHWFEGMSPAKNIQGDGGVGTVVYTNISVANIPLPTQIKIVEADAGARWRGEFTGVGASGSQLWVYEADGPVTRITFRIDADLSGPAKMAEGLVVNSFAQMVEKTLSNVKALAES